MIRRHSKAIAIGIGCVVLGGLYGALAPVFNYHVEWAGVTMLVALCAAMGILVAVLEAGIGD
jgi:hypothetical protein